MTLLDPFGQPPFPLSYNNVIMYGDHMVREDIPDEHIFFLLSCATALKRLN